MNTQEELFDHPVASIAAAFSLVLDSTLARYTSSQVMTTHSVYCFSRDHYTLRTMDSKCQYL